MNDCFLRQRIMDALTYSADTGVFHWKIKTSARVHVGSSAGTTGNYVSIKLDGEKYQAHRLAWLIVYGKFPSVFIDHINGIKTDNRIVNLREATRSVNGQNMRRAYRNNRSGMLGVSAYKDKFRATIVVDRKWRDLGFYDSAADAHAAYLSAKRVIHEGCTI